MATCLATVTAALVTGCSSPGDNRQDVVVAAKPPSTGTTAGRAKAPGSSPAANFCTTIRTAARGGFYASIQDGTFASIDTLLRPGTPATDAGWRGVGCSFVVADPKGGYWEVNNADQDNGIIAYGGAPQLTYDHRAWLYSLTAAQATPDGTGIYGIRNDGTVVTAGSARSFGDVDTFDYNYVTGIAVTASGNGYWAVDAAGHVYARGDAIFRGDSGGTKMDGYSDITTDIVATPDGGGYYTVSADGHVACYGNAVFRGDLGNSNHSGDRSDKTISSMAVFPGNDGYWLIHQDGVVVTIGR